MRKLLIVIIAVIFEAVVFSGCTPKGKRFGQGLVRAYDRTIY